MRTGDGSHKRRSGSLPGSKNTIDMSRRSITRIFVHCTGGSNRQTAKDVAYQFILLEWDAPGYHYVVESDGKVVQLLSEDKRANGVKGYNENSIHVAWIGGLEGSIYLDNRTQAQKEALEFLLHRLTEKYPGARLMGHRDIWGKDPSKWKKVCPCFDVEKEYGFLTR